MIVTPVKRSVVSAQFLHRAYLGCLKIGARKPMLLDALGVSEAQLRDPLKRFDAQSVAALCEAAELEIKTDNIFDDLGFAMLPTCFSDAGYSALFESSFEDALRATLIAQDLGGHQLPYTFLVQDGELQLIWDADENSDALVQLVFANMIHISWTLAKNRLRPVKSVQFNHSKPADLGAKTDIANVQGGVQCQFNQDSNRLVFHADAIKSANPRANHLIVHSASQRRIGFDNSDDQDLSLSKLCYNYLAYLLDKSGLSLDSAAATFSMAERTLRRKLVAEKSSFRFILEQVRRDACQLYFLEGTRSLSEIASKLGYSELSAFTRAYTAWYGHPPSHDISPPSPLAA